MFVANLKSWILSFDELRVLLFSLGFEMCEGIFMEEKTFSENEVLRTLYRLTQKQIIYITEQKFEVIPELKKHLIAIGNPDHTEIITAADGKEYYCYFRDQDITATDRYWQRKETVRITCLTAEQYQEWRDSLT